MDNSPAEVLAAFLQTDSAAPFSDPADETTWPLYVASMPDGENAENDCGACYDTAGVKDARTFDGANLFLHGVQLTMRSTNYAEGWAKAEEVEALLSTVHNEAVSIGDAVYQIESVDQTSPAFALGAEQGTRRRELFTMNFLIRLSQTT